MTTFRALLFVLCSVPAARAQTCETFGPLAPDLRVSEALQYDQFWVQCARGGPRIAFTWSQGQDIIARIFDTGLQPITGDFAVNTTLSFGNQDEPAIAVNGAGRTLIAWSDREAFDGEQMGVFARLYGADGAPLGPEFQVNVWGQTSQWRPLITTTPQDGFVVAWSGDWDGDAYFRVFDADGQPTTGDVRVNVYEWDAQVDPACAVAPDGTVFVAFVDYASHGGFGDGLNVWGRTFDLAGNPHQPFEFPLTSWASNGAQREPRVAWNPAGHFVVAWEDSQHDGSGYGIFVRRFALDATPLGPEFQANATTGADQRGIALAVDAAGTWTLAYEDRSLGASSPRVLARRFDAGANPLGPEVVVNSEPATGTLRVTAAAHPTSGEVLFAYEGPGWSTDVFARPMLATAGPHAYCSAKTSSLGCTPAIGWQGMPSASSPQSFRVTCSQVIGQKSGFLVYALGSRFLPFQGGTLCVASPFQRTPPQLSQGSLDQCDGLFGYEFNARIQSGVDPSLAPGATVSAQYYYRDPADPAGFGSGLSDAVRFVICP